MGGTPRYALVSLAMSQNTSRAWLSECFAGVLVLARRFGVTVVGGDTNIVPDRTSIDVVIAGEIGRGKMICRSGARPGDQIYVSGRLGLSSLGLHRLKENAAARRRGKMRGAAIRAHLYPEPRVSLGRSLSENRLASAMIDVSDGLSTDLAHLCHASGVGARIWAGRLPVPSGLTLRDRRALNPLDLALDGGEDYELLFTVPERHVARLRRQLHGVPFHWIGEIRKVRAIRMVLPCGREIALAPRGYDHFKINSL